MDSSVVRDKAADVESSPADALCTSIAIAVGVEIERKFLVASNAWRSSCTGVCLLRQGYIAIDAGNTVRIRTEGDRAWLTIKGEQRGLQRAEFEYDVATDDADMLMLLCRERLVEKTRHLVPHGDLVFEVDEFHGENEGLVLAELELPDASLNVNLPIWIGREVSDDPRYSNASLSVAPFRLWREVG